MPMPVQAAVADASQLRLYETILEAVPDLVYVFDLERRFVNANQALLEMWDRSWEEARDESLLELGYEPWHAAMHEAEIDRVLATGRQVRSDVPFEHATVGPRIYDYIFIPV